MPDNEKIERAAEIQKAIDEADERKRADAEGAAQKLDKLLITLDSCVKKIDRVSSRMDALEEEHRKEKADAAKYREKARRHDDDDDEMEEQHEQHAKDNDDEPSEEQDEGDERKREGSKPGQPREVVADRADAMRRHEARLADAQANADAVAAEFGERAPAPLSGETLRAYRCRLLRRYRHHSKEFADADLAAIDDPKLFAGIEARIYADAKAASATPDVPAGYLWERVKTDASGRKISEFFGTPRTWMRQFSGSADM